MPTPQGCLMESAIVSELCNEPEELGPLAVSPLELSVGKSKTLFGYLAYRGPVHLNSQLCV